MARRISKKRTIGWVVAFAVLAAILMAYGNKLDWLAGFEFSDLFVYLIAVVFCLVLGYWVWDKYGKSKRTLLEQEKLFDELGAVEAETTQVETIQLEPQLNQQPQQEEAEVSHEIQETQEPRASTVPVQLDLLGFSTKQK